NGDFSALLNPADPGNPLPGSTVSVIDPQNGRAFVGNIIPLNRLDPAALAVAKLLPQASGNGQIRYVQPLSQNFHEFLGRVAHALSSRNRLTVRYFVDRFAQEPELDPRNVLTYSDSATIVSSNALVQAQHLFGAGLVNDTHFSYSSVRADRT